jgi:hypothetical protein
VLRRPFKAFCLNLPEKQLHEGAPLAAFILLKDSREASNHGISRHFQLDFHNRRNVSVKFSSSGAKPLIAKSLAPRHFRAKPR